MKNKRRGAVTLAAPKPRARAVQVCLRISTEEDRTLWAYQIENGIRDRTTAIRRLIGLAFSQLAGSGLTLAGALGTKNHEEEDSSSVKSSSAADRVLEKARKESAHSPVLGVSPRKAAKAARR